jgi:lipopolysaccharide transport system ATP-binding protein
LLKVLSRITEPSEGRVEIHGRVASLLEVGTGFHPELTGRENIFLNGAILGMGSAEIRRKFDEIVAFAEVEKFLDTPVKRYSSGMYVRLAFAVAAHLEPEILVIDEVLAVGDAEFQKKCLGKMGEVAGQGRTVLFVSHNMAAVRKLCTSGMLLSEGSVAALGPINEVIGAYFSKGELSLDNRIDLRRAKRRGDGKVCIEEITFPKFEEMHAYRVFQPLCMRFHLAASSEQDMQGSTVWFLFRNSAGDDVMMVMQKDGATTLAAARQASVEVRTSICLAPGRYLVACGILSRDGIADWIDDAFAIEVDPLFENGEPFDGRYGLATMTADWRD